MSKRRRSVLLWVAVTSVLGAIVHYVVVLAVPYAIGHHLTSLAESNTIVHAEKPSAGNERVRRSGPDLVYSACPFDLSDGPLHITAPVPESYMSVSFYAINTDNFYVKNDLQVDGDFDIVLIGPDMPAQAFAGIEVVRSPSMTGGILFRYFAGNEEQIQEIESIRRRITIRPCGIESDDRGRQNKSTH